MLRSVLIGLLAGARSMTPLAAVALAGKTGRPGFGFLSHRAVRLGATALAAGEMMGDKWRRAPDRIVAPGMAARLVTGAIAGGALAPKGRARAGMALGAAAAVAGAYVTWRIRMAALRRYGQARSGLVEDALTVLATSALTASARG